MMVVKERLKLGISGELLKGNRIDLIYVLERLLWLPFGDWIIERKNEEVTRDGMTVVTQGRDGGGLD